MGFSDNGPMRKFVAENWRSWCLGVSHLRFQNIGSRGQGLKGSIDIRYGSGCLDEFC